MKQVLYDFVCGCNSLHPANHDYELANTLELKLTDIPPDTSFSLLLSAGICFGAMADTNIIKQVKYAGSARILATA